MEDGQVGIVTKWVDFTPMVGQIVQRYGNKIIVIGKHSGKTYTNILSSSSSSNLDGYTVTIITEINVTYTETITKNTTITL